MAEVTGMTPDRIAQEITKETTNLKTYVNSNLSRKADTTYVDSGLSKKADITYVDSLVPLKSFMGSGFPEGKVAAPVGTIYIDAEATNGAVRWIKTIGINSTGWRVEHGDTGWRVYDNVSGGVKSGRVLIRRKEYQVFIHFDNMIPESTGTNISLGRLPVGFRGTSLSNRWVMLNGISTTADIYTGNVSGLGYANIYGQFSIAPVLTGTASYLTEEVWPSSLPGTPY